MFQLCDWISLGVGVLNSDHNLVDLELFMAFLAVDQVLKVLLVHVCYLHFVLESISFVV